MLDKKIARLMVCRLKGHTINSEDRCHDCYMNYWLRCPISSTKETTIAGYDALMEAIDAR